MHRNLSEPLEELNELAAREFRDLPIAQLRVGLRTGDTTASQRAVLVRKPPHILVTTPESLFLLLTAERGRAALKTVDTIIVDEIHALVRDKRGSHLALSLERLEALCDRRIQRIGLSATQKPIERIAAFLVGGQMLPERCESATGHDAIDDELEIEADLDCEIVDIGHSRELDLRIEVPPSELSAVRSNEQWGEINERIIQLINSHRSTLIFVNTRRLAERVTHQLSELLGEDQVGSHHGSLSTEKRLKTERELKSGDLKAVVATASLELGLDVGFIDLVIQIGSPRSIATLLQRIGRSGHSLGKTPKGRLFALTRDELMECMALVRAIRSGRLDVIPIPECPIDVLAQQVVGEVANQEWGTDELFMLFRRAWPYRNLTRDAFNQTIEFLSEGLTDRAGRAQVYIHHDRVQKNLRARPGARIAATSNAGTIPEIGSFRVVAEPNNTVVGTLDEALEGEGIVLRGHFRSKHPSRSDNAGPKDNNSKADTEWCQLRLLARIHRLTMDGLRREIEPVTTNVYFQFLTDLHGLKANSQRASVNGVFEVVSILQGLDIAASAWEADVLKSRFDGYQSEWLDELCLGGEVTWARLFAPVREKETPANLTKVLPVSIFLREDIAWLNPDRNDGAANHMSPIAVQLLEQLSQQRAMFVSDLQSALVASRRNSNSDSAASLGEIDKSDVLPTLGELVTLGLVTSDGFAGLRGLVQAKVTETRAERSRTSRFIRTRNKTAGSGRWSLSQLGRDAIESLAAAGIDIGAKLDRECDPEERIEQWAWQLIRRWGVVFRDVLIKEHLVGGNCCRSIVGLKLVEKFAADDLSVAFQASSSRLVNL